MVEPRPFRDGGYRNAVVPGRVLYETHTQWNSSRTLPGLWQRIASPVAEKRPGGVRSLSCAVHRPVPMQRMFRTTLSFSISQGHACGFSATADARLLSG